MTTLHTTMIVWLAGGIVLGLSMLPEAKIGTKSVIFGAHCFLIHPWFVALAWWILYGFPWDPRLWVAFFVHDLGYLGKPNMDGPEGECHPEFGAKIMRIFGKEWADFSLLHSRYYAKKLNRNYSRLCVADKLAIFLTPRSLYLPMAHATGELHEYLENSRKSSESGGHWNPKERTPDQWHKDLEAYMVNWVLEHRDSNVELWVTKARHTN